MPPSPTSTINIRPGVSILSVLSHLEYTQWHALAEYVDNALQSFLHHREALCEAGTEQLRVSISVNRDAKFVEVRDNAAGIAGEDFPRAFRPAEVPPDAKGLSEFGMGMKTASCWFSPHWSVETSALGDPVQRRVVFDVPTIVASETEDVDVETRAEGAEAHYTIVRLTNCRNIPQYGTKSKVQRHLSDIYRDFIRSGDLELIYDGVLLKYEAPDILEAPAFNTSNQPEGNPVLWRREVDFEIGQGRTVQGFAGILAEGSTQHAGFSLFRRRRVIQGSGDEKYRPDMLFGNSNSFAYQRIFGEFHLDGFDVSHTKNGFKWDDMEEDFQKFLCERLNDEEMPLLRQARNYRVTARPKDFEKIAGPATLNTGKAIENGGSTIFRPPVPRAPSSPSSDLPGPLPQEDKTEQASSHLIELDFDDRSWRILLECSTQTSDDWYQVANEVAAHVDGPPEQRVGVRLHLNHPFMNRLPKLDAANLEPFVRIAAGLALAEVLAREAGDNYGGGVRRIFNELLAGPLSQSETLKEPVTA